MTVTDFGIGHLKAIGTIKLIGAIGLVVPAAVGVASPLVPLAACGLMLFMAGDVAFIGLFGFLAWGPFAVHPFA